MALVFSKRVQRVLCTIFITYFFAVSGYGAEKKFSPISIGIGGGMGKQAHLGPPPYSDVDIGLGYLQVQSRIHDHFEFMTEFTLGKTGNPASAYTYGLNIGGRINCMPPEQTFLFLGFGVGINSFGLKIPELSGTTQRIIHLNGGLKIQPKGSSLGFVVEYRLLHFSNAGNSPGPNIGINLNTLLVGFNFSRKG